MKRRVLKIGAICALSASMSLAAATIDNNSIGGISVDTDYDASNYLQVSAGLINFKNLDKTKGLIDIMYLNTKFCNNREAGVLELKLSDGYKDFSVINVYVPKLNINQNGKYIGLVSRLGYLQHDSYKYTSSNDINQPMTIQNQKAPYLSFEGVIGMTFGGVIMNASINYKMPLDRADMKGGYGADANINYFNWHLAAGYQKLNFRGVEDQEDVSIKIGYTFNF